MTFIFAVARGWSSTFPQKTITFRNIIPNANLGQAFVNDVNIINHSSPCSTPHSTDGHDNRSTVLLAYMDLISKWEQVSTKKVICRVYEEDSKTAI